MMLLAVTVSAILLSTFSAIPVMCVVDGYTSSSSLPVTSSIHQHTTTLHPHSHFKYNNAFLSQNRMPSLPQFRKYPDAPKKWKANQKYLKNIITPERKHRGNFLMNYLNYFREIFETYSTSSNQTQNIITSNQTSVPVKLVQKSKSFLEEENYVNYKFRFSPRLQYNLDRRGIKFPIINTNNIRRALFQRNSNFKHIVKRKLSFIDDVFKIKDDFIDSNEVDRNKLCTADVNKTCVFKRSANFRVSKNIPKLVGSSMTVTKDSLPLYNSHSTTTGTISDLSSLTDRHTNTSFEEKANLTKNEPHPSASKIRQHNKRSNRSRGEPGRPSRRSRRPGRGKRRGRRNKGLSLWIDSKQVKTFSGYVMEIFVIHNSRVLPYILDPKFEGQLPVIPAQVESVNFTWRAGSKKYYYAFDHLYSQDEGMLGVPVLSLPTRGRVPRRPRVTPENAVNEAYSSWFRVTFVVSLVGMCVALLYSQRQKSYCLTRFTEAHNVNKLEMLKCRKRAYFSKSMNTVCVGEAVFSVEMRCTGNASGTTTFGIGLSLHTQQGQPLPGTPLRLQLRKECNYIGPDPECDEKCDNGGVCDEGQRCVCAEGYLGLYCDAALCYPRCMNGGTCTSPGRCSCPPGFNGRHCEGGICQHKCQNGGKCIQKDTCECRRGYYGNQCEFSKCVIPCVNGGRCRDVNMCRCPHGFTGDHCEVMLSPLSPSSSSPSPSSPSSTPARCRRRCRHGSCHHDGNCRCHPGYTGRWCRRRNGRGGSKKKVWI